MTAFAAVLSVVIAVISTPIYQAEALLQVEEKTASLPGLEDLARLSLPSRRPAELEIIVSRSVIGTAVDNLELTTISAPKYFPYIGDYLARRFKATEEILRSPVLGLTAMLGVGKLLQ